MPIRLRSTRQLPHARSARCGNRHYVFYCGPAEYDRRLEVSSGGVPTVENCGLCCETPPGNAVNDFRIPQVLRIRGFTTVAPLYARADKPRYRQNP